MKRFPRLYTVIEVLILGLILFALAAIGECQNWPVGAHNTQYSCCPHFSACGSDPFPVPGMFTCDPILYAQNAQIYATAQSPQQYFFPPDIRAIVQNNPGLSVIELANEIVLTSSWYVNGGETLEQWLSNIRLVGGCPQGPAAPPPYPTCPAPYIPTLTPTRIPTFGPTPCPTGPFGVPQCPETPLPTRTPTPTPKMATVTPSPTPAMVCVTVTPKPRTVVITRVPQ